MTERKKLMLAMGEEIVIQSGTFRVVVRGTRDSLQLFSEGFSKTMYAGTTKGVIKTNSFSVGKYEGILPDIPTMEI